MEPKERDYFNTLYEVAKVVNSSLKPKEVLQRIVEALSQALGVKACALRVLDQSKQVLSMGACSGLSEGYLRKGPVTISESGLDRQALSGEVVFLEDVQTSPQWQYKDRAKQEGIHSVLVVPLMVEDKAVGVLRAYTDQVRQFDPDEIKLLQAAAHLSAIALENARLHQALQRDYDLLLQHEYRLDDN